MTDPNQTNQTAVGQAVQVADTQANTALTVLEKDAVEFIQAATQHAKDAVPLLTGELANGLNALIAKAEALAAKHGFSL